MSFSTFHTPHSHRMAASRHHRSGAFWPALALAPWLACNAHGADEPNLFPLGQVEVTGTRARDDASVDAAAMQRDDALNVGAALAQVPGVTLSKVGARNEVGVQVRGFDLRQTPIFVDGVPVYVPYDGYVDLGRFTTFDLSKVTVEKGYSSMLYGANTLGGAINLVGRRPARANEVQAGFGVAVDHGADDARWLYSQYGTRQGAWWLLASASVVSQDSFPVAGGYQATTGEDGGPRNNSDALDRKLSLKLGWQPRADDEYTLSLIDQHGIKGTPPYAGSVAGVAPRYWRWPYWDKQSLYAVSKTRLGDAVLKLRAFHDTFRNSLFTYDDASYTTQKKPSSFQSWYDDYTNGLSAQLDTHLGVDDTLGLAAHWKTDIHREHNLGEPVRHDQDETSSLAAELTHRFTPALSLVGGIGHDARRTVQAQDYNSKTGVVSEFAHGSGGATNAQLALRQDLGSTWYGQLSLARKSRFPTIKDRYSYRLGTALPNADLRPERATHLELSAAGQALSWLRLRGALFHSDIDDLIQSVTITPMCGSVACTQMQNIGRARTQGLELGADAQWGGWQLDGHYQYLDRANLSNAAVKLTDTPRHQAQAHLGWHVAPAWVLHANANLSSSRYSNSTGSQVAGRFAVLDLKAQWQASALATFEAALHNATDRCYAYTEGFPEPGRQLVLQVRLNWQ